MELKETKELVGFMIEIAHSLDKSFEDKKLDAADLVNFLPLIMKAPDALKGANKIADEFKAASSDSRDSLIKEIKQDLDLKNDRVELLVEESLVLAQNLFKFIDLVRKK